MHKESMAFQDPSEPLRVAFNAVPLLSPLTGIGQYTRSLIEAFASRPDVETYNFYAAGWSHAIREGELPRTVNRLKSIIRRGLPNSYGISRFIQQQRFSKGIRPFAPDVYHEPNYLAFRCDAPTVITVHDLSWIRYPETHPPERVAAMNRYFEAALRRATEVITDSEAIRQELLATFGMEKNRVHAIPLASDALFKPMSEDCVADVMIDHGLVYGEYWLSVGTLEPRKNLHVLLEAFGRLPKAIRKRCPLVLAGIRGWQTSHLEALLAPWILSGEVVQLGYLSRQHLAAVVAGAKAMVYPSIYEGFGLPPLEAMSCGIPVITSNASSLPEVIGDSGIMIDPFDASALSEAMARVYEDDALRKAMSVMGLERSARFSWQTCAASTIKVYFKALGRY